jgi:hypothetical protein
LINWLIENLESAQDIEYVDLTEINKKYSDIVNGSKVLLEIILNTNKSWKVLIRGKTVNPAKIGLDELYNLDSVVSN